MSVEAVAREQGRVSALFSDLTLAEHNDMVGIVNRGEAVSDHEGSPPFGEMGECLMDQLLVDSVEMRSGLV